MLKLSQSTYSEQAARWKNDSFLQQDSPLLNRECSAYLEHMINIFPELEPLVMERCHSQKSNSPVDKLLEAVRDGVILSHLIAKLNPEAISLKEVNYCIAMDQIGKPRSKSLFQVGENLSRCVEGAKKLSHLGVVVVNLGPNDILDKNVDVVLGLVWQLIRAHLFQHVNLVSHPELIRLLSEGESLRDLMRLDSESILLRWFNYHLKHAQLQPIANFAEDIADGAKYIALLEQICPTDVLNGAGFYQMLATLSDLSGEELDLKRAEIIVDTCQAFDCRSFVRVADISNGHHRLNLGFTAGLFNKYIGIVLPSDDEVRKLVNDNELLNKLLTDERSKSARLALDLETLQEQSAKAIESMTERMNLAQHQEIEMLKQSHEHLSLQSKNDAEKELMLREQEFRSIIEATKAKAKQQLYVAERETLNSRQKLTQDLLKIKSELDSYFNVGHDQASENKLENLPEVIAHHVHQVLMEVEKLQEKVQAAENNIKRLKDVNDLYGDKIQEYAEGKIQEKQRQDRRKRFPSMRGLI
eukprot:Partr_v1_DN28820_c1_g1_i2_m34287 putative lymphocyte cytosolic protein 1 (L-plastin)